MPGFAGAGGSGSPFPPNSTEYEIQALTRASADANWYAAPAGRMARGHDAVRVDHPPQPSGFVRRLDHETERCLQHREIGRLRHALCGGAEQAVERALDMVGRGNDEPPRGEVRRQRDGLLGESREPVAEQHERVRARRARGDRIFVRVGLVEDTIDEGDLGLQLRAQHFREIDRFLRKALRVSGNRRIPHDHTATAREVQRRVADPVRTLLGVGRGDGGPGGGRRTARDRRARLRRAASRRDDEHRGRDDETTGPRCDHSATAPFQTMRAASLHRRSSP